MASVKQKKIAILDRNPAYSDEKMVTQRSWITDLGNPSSYNTKQFVYSPEVSTYFYLRRYYKQYKFDLLQFEDITNKNKMKSYDHIFIFNHGLSDAFPIWKNKTNAYTKAWKELGKKVTPSYNVANFILDKCEYYALMNRHGIKTAKTFCITNIKQYDNLINFVNINNIKKVFLKPIGGDSGRNTSAHNAPYKNLKHTLTDLLTRWKKVVIQEFMEFSTTENPEYKCLFVGNKLQYIVKTFKLGEIRGLIMPHENWHHMKTVKSICNKVIKLFNSHMKTQLTHMRIDLGYDSTSKTFFLNEIEHAPGTYGDLLIQLGELTENEWKIDSAWAKEVIKIIRK